MAADGSVVIAIEGDDSKFKSALGKLENVASGAIKGITTMVAGASTAVAGLAAGAAKVGSEFETALAGTSTMFGDVEVDTAGLTDQILELSNATGLAATDINSSLYNALSAGIPVTEDMTGAMEYMESAAKLAAAGFTDVDTAVTATAKVMNAYGKGLDDVDQIQKVMLQTQNKGITTVNELGSTLAQVTPTAAAMGVSFENVGAALATMTAQGTPTAQATTQLNSLIAELGKSGTTAAKNLQKATEGTQYAGKSFTELMNSGVPLNEVLDLMAGYAADNGLSMIDMFSSIEAGKSALAMAGDNSAKFAENLAAMSTETDVVGSAYSKVTDTFEHNVNTLKEGVTNLGIAVYDGMKEPLKNAASVASGMIAQITDAFKEGGLSGAVGAVGKVLAQLVTEITKAAPKMIQAGIKLLQSLITGIVDNLPTIAAGAAEIVTSLANGIIELLPQITLAAVDLVIALANGLADNLPTLIPAAINAIITLVQGLIDNIPMLIDAALQLIMGLAQGIIDAIPILIDALPTLITSLIDGILSAIPQIIQAGIDLLTALVDALPTIITSIVQAIPEIINGILTALTDNLPLIIQAGIDLLVSLIQALPTIITTIVQAIPEIIGGILDALIGNIDKIIMAGVQIFVALVENLPQIIIEIVKAIPPIIAGIVDAIGKLTYKLVEAGGNLLKGLWEGISNAASWLWEKVTGWASGLIDGIKGLFGIHSPSTVFAEIGQNTIKGFENGVDDEVKKAEKQVLSTMDGLSDSMSNALDDSVTDVSVIDGLVSSATSEIQSVKTVADNAVSAFCEVFESRTDDFYETGKNAMDGLSMGIMEQGRAAIESARQIANGIISEMRRALDIHSPSRKLRDLVGIPAMDGMMQGFEIGMSDFGRKMQTAVDAETAIVSANISARSDENMARNQVVREVHTNNRTVEKIARVEGDGITDELIRLLGLKLKAEDRRAGMSFA